MGQALWHRHLLVGSALGFLFSVPALLRAVGEQAASWQAALLSAIFSSVFAALFISATTASSFALLSFSPRFRLSALRVSAVVGALSTALYVLLRGTAEAWVLSSGSSLNLGTIEFVRASFGQLAGPVLVEYAPLTLMLCCLVVGFSVPVFLYLARPVGGCKRPFRILGRGVASALALVALVRGLSTPGLAQQSGLSRTADLALIASAAARAEEQRQLEERARRLGVVIPRGKRLTSGDLWEKAVSRLEGPRPNVVIVMMESVGIDHLGYSGYRRPVTPELDRIAEGSLRFRQARSTATHSNYAQMAALSSLFPRRFSGFDAYKRLDYPRVLWHDFLTAIGYRTATYSSQDETWQGMLRFQTTDTKTEYHHSGTYEGKRIRMGSEEIVPDEVTVTRAIQWIEHTQGPFGLYVNLQSTHFPYRVPAGAPAPYQPTRPTRGKFHYLNYPEKDVPVVINRYDNALSYVDTQIGRLYSFLERTSRLDDTIFIVTSDHGESFGENGLVTHGRSLFEEEARVPLLVHYPKAVRPGDDDRLASTLDLLPTLGTLLDVPPHPAFQGTSLLEERDPRRPVFMNIQGMKSGDAVVCGRYKFVLNRSAETEALYDLESDPKEETNLALEKPDVTDKLKTLLRAQMRVQMRYHSPSDDSVRTKYYAPRFGACPGLDGEHLPEDVADTSDLHAAAGL